MRRTSLAALVLCLACPVLAGETVILNEKSFWRYYVTRKPPVITPAAYKAAGKSGTSTVNPRGLVKYTSAPPPRGWTAPDHDDSIWPRSKARLIFGQVSTRAHTHRVSMRGKFEVKNPSAVGDLTLTLSYRGGVVVYLNGKEVARQHLPEGKLENSMSAEFYANSAWVNSKGKAHSHRKPAPKERNRRLAPVKIDKSALRKGVNVLAVELWRTDFHPVAIKWRDHGHPPTFDRWVPINLFTVSLSATGSGATPNVKRPTGIQVWVRDRNDFMTADDYGDPNEARRPLKLVGARNGSYSAQLGVGSPTKFAAPKVTVSDLKAVKGKGTIPATQVKVLYGRMTGNWCDAFHAKPPAEVPTRSISPGRRMKAVPVGATLPVLIRVKIPKDTVPGDYRGEVTVSADGKTAKRPLELYVADWAVPYPKDFRTYVDLYQSPETLAMQYKVEMWSEKHWKLMEKSWELLGRAGNKLVLVNAAMETQFGNPHSTIYLVKKRSAGWDYDFTNFDRLMKLALKHCGQIDHVGLQVWHVGNIKKTGSGWGVSPLDQIVELTVKDPKTGALSRYKVPKFDTAESKKFWKPYLAAVDARLNKLGLKGTLCVGILMDSLPSGALFKTFDEIWPGGGKSRWMRGCHVATSATRPSPPRRRSSDGLIVLQEYCYGGGVRNPKFSEARNYPGAYYFRASNETRVPLTMYQTFGDFALYKGTKGVGRICLDFWPVLGNPRNRRWRKSLINRYPYSDCMQRKPTIQRMSWPAPDGAAPSARLEAFIEGVQDTEAVIVLRSALEKSKDRLGAELVASCEKLLKDRRAYQALAWTQYENRSYGPAVLHPHHWGWQGINKRLYDCAAEVSKKLK
jgi:Glycoside hydrolase 123, catalytic domain